MKDEDTDISCWFTGLTIYRKEHPTPADEASAPIYEERMVIVWARTFEEADEKIKVDAFEYEKQSPEIELVSYRTLYCTQEEELTEAVEVWSILRESPLLPKEYIKKYHDNERESCLLYHAEQTPRSNVVNSVRSG